MPTYEWINKETGEITSNYMSIAALDKYKEEHPELERYFGNQNVATVYGKPKQSDGFKQVMQKIQSAHPGANLTDLLDYAAKKAKDTCSLWYDSETDETKKPINMDHLKVIEPLTDNQERVFTSYAEGKHLVLHGAAGTGKTFISLYLALKDVLEPSSPYEKVYMVRSLVPTREIGFLPGDHEDKSNLYQIPYKNMVKYMFQMPDDAAFDMLYDNLRAQETISFWSTSFIRGTTLDDCIVIVDEFSNLNFHELDSIITRIGQNSKIIFSGDYTQSDLVKSNEKNGVLDFMRILNTMPSFDCVEFGIEDIVRSGLVREYLVSKINLGF